MHKNGLTKALKMKLATSEWNARGSKVVEKFTFIFNRADQILLFRIATKQNNGKANLDRNFK